MSESLNDDLRDKRASTSIDPAAGVFFEGDPYQPDITAYLPDPKNDLPALLRSSLNSSTPPTMTLSVRASDGLREVFELNTAETRAYFEADIATRHAMSGRKIREKRVEVARKAVTEMREKNLGVDDLTPYAELCLWQFDMLEEASALVPIDTGGYARGVTHRLKEDAHARILREDFGWDSGGYNSGAYSDASFGEQRNFLDQEYLGYGGPQGKQLYLNDVFDQQAKTFYVWHHDPVAQEGCNIIRNFVLGRGMTVTCNDERVQKWIDDFDTREGMDDRWKTWTVGLSRDGELFIRLIRLGDGTIRVRSLPPDTIWEIVTDAEDIESIYYFAQRYFTRTQIFQPPEGDAQHWVSRDLPADEVIHIKINAAECEVRGRSDLFVILGDLKRLRDVFDTIVLKDQAQAAYAFDATIDGGATDVQNFVQTALPKGKPAPGSFFAHNKAATIQVLNSGKNTGSMGQGSSVEGLLSRIAIGLGISKDYLGVTSRGSRATALVATEPTAMRLEERQDTIGSGAHRLYSEVIKEGRDYGWLDGVTDFSFEITFPEIQKDDASDKIDLICTGVGMQFLSHKTAATMYADEISIDDYDYDEECEKIAAEMQAENPPLILAKYASIPMGDSATGVAGAAYDDGQAPAPVAPGQPALPGAPAKKALPNPASAPRPQGSGNASPSSKTGAAQIRKDLGPKAPVQQSAESVTERWLGSYA